MCGACDSRTRESNTDGKKREATKCPPLAVLSRTRIGSLEDPRREHKKQETSESKAKEHRPEEDVQPCFAVLKIIDI